MATQLQFRRYTTAELASITGAPGELIVDTDLNTVTIHDGTTVGGHPVLNISADSLITVVDLGTNDPIGAGVEADISAEGVAPDGSRWKKVGAGNNEWEQIIMAGSGTVADVNPGGTQIAEALDTKINSNYAHLTYFGDGSGALTMKNIIGEIASGDVPGGSELVQIGNSVTSIGSNAFTGWSDNNQPLVFGDSVTEIGPSAFSSWLSNNQPLVFPDSVEIIGSIAFYEWDLNNQPLVIPDSVTSIGDYAFRSWNSNNKPLVIGDVTSIGSYAFQYWGSMTEPIYCGFNFSAFTGSGAFAGNGVTQIYVKPGATGWTIGVGQEIQGASGITVSNWNNYPIAIPN